MKTLGLLGGMSWESSLEYYRIINETVKAKLGGLHSAKCVLYSVDFAEIELLQNQGKWDEATAYLCNAAHSIERAGAECLLICTNTMHKMADDIQAQIQIPVLHIADAAAQRIQTQELHTVGLLGTKFTMEQDFYKGRLTERYGLSVLIPNEAEREEVHRVIYEELCLGKIQPSSKERFLAIIQQLQQQKAEGIILGCTEIPLLIQQADCPIPLFDTTRIHAEAAVEYMLGDII
ncbi:aspartate racemase [Candidatus Vecturithrix granuli]|uniref:Aspartate racemase n=1 Tax=Vecturithrix granuli TaxID=1499967 RepID=A0A081C9B7_VECG1|nr:aspartate racemase [Candidatus Vecturithrix granuli]